MSETKKYDIFELIGKAEENLRKLMSRTVDAYPTEWITVHEAIQNARDAIQKSSRADGEISITMDLTNQEVVVSDNGRGFTPSISLLGIGGTDKNVDDWTLQGNQGVGLKAVLLSTCEFKLESVSANKKWTVTCKNAYKYKEGRQVSVEEHPLIDLTAPNGTTLSYRFPDRRVSDLIEMIWDKGDTVSQILASNAAAKLTKAVEWYFRSYSYAGDVNRLMGAPEIKPIKFKVKITYSSTVPSEFSAPLNEIIRDCKDKEIVFPNIHWNVEDAVKMVERGKPKPAIVTYELPDGGKLQAVSSNVFWVAKYSTRDEYKLLLRNSSLQDQPDLNTYSDLFDSTFGIYIVVGALDRIRDFLIENPRRIIAANGIPSSHLIRDPTKGGELTYNRNIHFVMNVKATLNYGKQNITNTRLLATIYDFYTDAYRATLKNVAKAIVGTEASETGAGGYYDRVMDKDRNIVQRQKLPIDTLSIKRVPKDENAVIALFYELIGMGILKDFDTYSLHGKSRYDGKMMIKNSDMKKMPIPKNDDELAIVEFKQKTRELINDFENDKKIPKEIDLFVVWENDFEDNTGYQIVDIQYTPDDDKRFFGVKKCLKDKMTGWHIQMLILKEFLEEYLKEKTAEKAPK